MLDVSKMTNEELKIANVEISAELRKREDEERTSCGKILLMLFMPTVKDSETLRFTMNTLYI